MSAPDEPHDAPLIEPEGGEAILPSGANGMTTQRAFEVLHAERCSYKDLLAAIAFAVAVLEDEDRLLIHKINKDELGDFQKTVWHRLRSRRPKPERLFAANVERAASGTGAVEGTDGSG